MKTPGVLAQLEHICKGEFVRREEEEFAFLVLITN